MKKTLALFLVFLMAVSLTACGGSNESGSSASGSPEAGSKDGKVSIIITNGKGEIATQWEQAAKDFMAANPDIEVEAISQAVGDTVNLLDKLTASGKTVTMAMMAPDSIVNKYKDFGVDLSGEKWNADTVYGVKDASGKVAGFPFSIEGFGLVYNKSVVEKATGGTFDPYSINTRDKLKALFDKIQASGVKYPVAYQTENWSVANHYSTQFLNQAEDPSTIVEQLKAGTFDLASNPVWNGYYDTMDLLASPQYNKYGERPLGKYYDDAHLSVGKGESAILFNGNWAFDSLKAVSGESFGFIPVPVDNNPDNPLNNKIAAGPTNILVINKAATPAEQDAAKKFLNWIVYDQKGQDFLVNQAQIVSAFKNNPNKVTNPLGAAIAEAVQAGKTLPFSSNYVKVEDWGNILAPDIQKYIAKKESRTDLAKVIENYFKTQK
ncbi:ABC transporter substrate-binding protein [Paenibacillus rhizophilus]|uniref:Carbohydrate ABC transporter substrate-binding protein n=1 Tax=Paenibacillus rhizophilus TaxID=1850366 RepID=A0A3N9P8H7_9BACL|nr:ABC transporter substrate-binding protein [Paenibacillus rhizophilus]RQW12528.1 carbohydrate ABC transporter substrate-binding protein [Paenibacillus rhizophilus]